MRRFLLFEQVVASYFPLSQCIEGLKVLVESLFGATFRSIPLTPGESWHPDVIKMSLHHPEEVCWLLDSTKHYCQLIMMVDKLICFICHVLFVFNYFFVHLWPLNGSNELLPTHK